MAFAFGAGCHLHLIDGSAYIFRAFHALPPLSRASDGLPVGAISGLCNMLYRYLEGNAGADAPTHAAVIFDPGGNSFRHDLYDRYKANRAPMPEDLRPQIPLTREAVQAFNIATCEIDGFEADDVIATLACQARTLGGRVTILSSDKDLMQLVGDGVTMLDPMKNRRIDADSVREKFGVPPERVVDVQALAGDSVDNIPGAPGIGIKTAALLVQEYGDLETLLARAAEIPQPKRRKALIENRAQIELSRSLARLDVNTPVNLSIDDLEVTPPDPEALLAFLGRMELRTLSRRVADRMGVGLAAHAAADAPQSAPHAVPFDRASHTVIRDCATLQTWIDKAHAVGHVAVDTETTGLDEMTVQLVGISVCIHEGTAAYIPLAHTHETAVADLFGNETSKTLVEGQMPLRHALAMLKPLLETPTVIKIMQNAKYDCKILARHGIDVAPIDDTMLVSYALHAGLHGHGMDQLSQRYLDHTPIAIKTLLGKGKEAITFDRVGIEAATAYAAEDADITLRLWRALKPRLHTARVTRVYETLERPMVAVLAGMERAGIKVDVAALSDLSRIFAGKMETLESDIYDLAGVRFNVGSPKQLGEVLFDQMGLAGGKKGKAGTYATGADILGDLASEGHDLPARVLDWRQVAKLKSTYTDALQHHVNPDTGRIHTSYSITGANTGRLASSEPNLQNIPIRTEEGRRIREAFVAEPGRVLVSLDYSQIELRILAHIARIDALRQAFSDGQDIHAITASQMFGVPLAQMTPEVRRKAKAINFGVIYGISGFGLARNLRIPRAQAQDFIDTYLDRFSGIRAYMDRTIAFAQKNLYVETLFGRKVHTPDINAKGPVAGFARRAAINAPIQGTAADIIRRAMIRMPAALAGLPATMLLQVHDELLFEVEEGAVDALIKAARGVMETAAEPAVKLSVALSVDAGQGANWATAH